MWNTDYELHRNLIRVTRSEQEHQAAQACLARVIIQDQPKREVLGLINMIARWRFLTTASIRAISEKNLPHRDNVSFQCCEPTY